MKDAKDLEDLIRRCAGGDRRAQNEVFRRLYGKMLGTCMRYAGNTDEAKDILQDGFLKVFGNIGNYNGKGSFEGWVRRIMVNTAIDAIRKKRQVFVSVDETDHDWLGEEENTELAWNRTLVKETERVMEAVQNLSPAYRTVFNLYVIEDYSHKEIAEMLGISEGTSKSNLSKAKAILKRVLKELNTDE